MLGPARRTDPSLTFSLLLWDHGRRLWERLANLAISSRISSYGGEKGREERRTDFSAGKHGAFTSTITPSWRWAFSLDFSLILPEVQ